VNSVASNFLDAVGDVLQPGGDGVALSIHCIGGSSCCIEKGLDLGFKGLETKRQLN